MLRLLALLLPLSLDTFAVSAALGAAGLAGSQRLRVSLLLTGFEAVMPLVGVAVGQAAGRTLGSLADFAGGAALLALGAYLLLARDDEGGTAARLARARGLAVIGLGVVISLDELAIGFSAGLLHLPLAWAIVLIAAQAVLAAQLGLRLGARLGEHVGEQSERIAALALITLGITFLAARVI